MGRRGPEDRTEGATALADRPAVRCRGIVKAYGDTTGRRGAGAALRHGPETPGANLALDGIDLVVPRGQALGVIGPNGAGKSTLLRVLAGITAPTAGSVAVDGTVRSVIELGTGFHDDLTGLENIRCLGVLHGRRVGEVDDAVAGIVDFAGLAHAIDVPLKQYSLGMKARLAFAIVTDQRPDLLVVDEVLAVGDQEFQAKCFERIGVMVEQGTTLVFVSHEMSMVASVCERVLQLRHGRIVDDGPATGVIERYLTRSASRIGRASDTPVTIVDGGVDTGSPGRDSLRLWVDVEVTAPVADPAVGFDVVLPMVDPTNVVSASTTPLAPMAVPGRYRISGATESLWGVGRNMRFHVSVVDRGRQRVLDTRSFDEAVVGDITGRRLGPLGVAMTIPLSWELRRERHRPARSGVGGARSTVAGADEVLALRGVSKHYRARTHGATIRPALPGRAGRLRHPDVTALDEVTIDIGRGESVGLIGPNASGKTTLLRVVAGVTTADSGHVAGRGKTLSLLELGAGFHPDLTGRENLRVLGRLMGIDRQGLERHLERAVEFAGLHDVVDHRLKTYSTGMTARLGLSMALVCPADLILIDEALSVGDEEFRRRSIDRIVERCRAGLSVLFVSHDLAMVEQVCERVVRLEHGRPIDDGPTDAVIGGYAGSSWAGGVHDAEGGIRIQRLGVDRHHVPSRGTLEVVGTLVVDEPVPDARLEFALRSPPHDRAAPLTIEERAAMTAMVETVVASGEELTRPGTYRFRAALEARHLVGEVDVVLSAVDEQRQVVLAEGWEQVVIGAPEPGAHLSFDPGISWSVERRGD